MRDMNARILLIITLVLSTVVLACPVLAVDTSIWSTYHYNMNRTGQNANSTDIKGANGPSTLNMIWVFPRLDAGSGIADEALTIADDLEPDFTYRGSWNVGTDSLAWGDKYHWRDVVTTGTIATAPAARWVFPSTLPSGKYLIYAWVPESGAVAVANPLKRGATSKATYTITDDFGTRNVVVDQGHGGAWRPLSSDYYSFTGAAGAEGVSLSALVTDAAATGEIVLADALKFVPVTGQEIYSSPVTAELERVVLPDPTDPALPDVWDGPALCVYTSTIEAALSLTSVSGSTQTRDAGAIYCIHGITPTLENPALPDGTPNPAVPNSDKLVKISKYLGTPKWRYPRNGAAVNSRLPIEGPIDGGLFSSPTLAHVPNPDKPGTTRLVLFATGMDRQLYAIDANTGDLLWKGPGVTVSEENNAWHVTDTRQDAFGGKFHYTECVDAKTTPSTSTWTVDTSNCMAGVAGLSYAVYAWLPGPGGTAGKQRTMDATYEITYAGTSGPVTATVKVDQSSIKNMGTWVKIGASYFNPTSVVLKNTATAEAPPPTGGNPPPAGGGAAAGGPDTSIDGVITPFSVTSSDYVAVADAIMVVPDTIEGLGYATPVVNVNPATGGPGTTPATQVYAMSITGRAMAFNTGAMPGYVGQLQWVYPEVRTVLSPDATQIDKPGWGDIGSSPAYSNGKLYVATLNGTVRCLENVTTTAPSQKWVFGSEINSDESAGGFTSSPCLDANGGSLYIGSTDGLFYCLNMETGEPRWQYPAATTTNPNGSPTVAPPLGAFRYSTPAFANVGGINRVWCGSSDGHIYSFVAGTGERLYVDEENGQHGPQYYSEPSLLSPIQGSIAMDGASVSGNAVMYVGDMKGTLHWRDAVNGSTNDWQYAGWNTPDMLFSSPSVSDTVVTTTKVSWVNVGCADGHLMAFTRRGGGWGGMWQGGDWPFGGDGPNSNSDKTTAAPETDIQFEIFSDQFFQKSTSLNQEPTPLDDAAVVSTLDNWDTDANTSNTILSRKMKVLDKTGLTTEDLVDKKLTDLAKERRQSTFFPEGRTDTSKLLCFEWGEKINIALWNLPEQKYLYGSTGQSKGDSITITMTNASAGSSAGSTFRGKVVAVKDYTVLEKDSSGYIPFVYPAGGKKAGEQVRRSYVLATIDLDGTVPNPPSPGPGWIMSVTIRRQSLAGTGAPGAITSVTIPLAKLVAKGTYYEPLMTAGTKGGPLDTFREVSIGINNPLGIMTDSPVAKIGWNDGVHSDRTAPDVHVNGNAAYTTAAKTDTNPSGFDLVPLRTPFLDLALVPHGTSSREAGLGIVDRSAMGMANPPGLQTKQIKRFKIGSGDLKFRDDRWPSAVECDSGIAGVKYGFKFPWDYGQGSIDYPDIFTRYQSYQQLSSDKDASGNACLMLPVAKDTANPTFSQAFLQPDTVLVSVDVPRFQPANVSQGYTKTMTAFVDSNGNNGFDSGNYVRGRPTTWQEAYRRFQVGLKVPPDPKIEVDEQTVDVGSAPHGLGDRTDGSLAFTAYNTNPLIQQWFKRITIKNAGNVNLYNIRINQALDLYGVQPSAGAVLPGLSITTSLDPTPLAAYAPFGQAPFVSSGPDSGGVQTYLGYTLSKPRVGDPDPTVMTIPDRRKWDSDYTNCLVPASDEIARAGWAPTAADARPLPVAVSVKVPLTQPTGTYQSRDDVNRVPYVAVFSDSSNANASSPIGPRAGDAVAMPSFQLMVTVRENQMTGGATPTTLPQIDYMANTGGAPTELLPRVGDATPAAFRDAADDKLGIHLFWSSNRQTGTGSYQTGDPKLASAPWFINHAELKYDGQNWKTADLLHWWAVSDKFTPTEQWLDPATANIMKWDSGGAGSDSLYAVRHFSPCIGENRAVSRTADKNRNWMAWAGTADVLDPGTNKISQQSMLFYADVTHGGGDSGNFKWFPMVHDQTMVKRYPCPVPDGSDMWMFWQGGASGNGSIYYSFAHDEKGVFDAVSRDCWSDDLKLRTPDCMSSVGSPNPVLRHLWAKIRDDKSEKDFPDAYRDLLSNSKKLFDVVYAGTNKITRNADIMLSRYIAAPPGAAAKVQPSRTAQPMARVFNETLARDSKFGFYTSKHLAWVRAADDRSGGLDQWGDSGAAGILNFPYVHVVFPEGYNDGTNVLDPGDEISATDGSLWKAGAPTGGVPIVPEKDSATGIYTYSYPANSKADAILGQMLVDFSSGIVRFTKPLRQDQVNGKSRVPEVHADYTPQAWRITTDSAADSSPRAFIEHTSMMGRGGAIVPGLDPGWDNGKPAPVDRLWVIWRKTGTSIESSTISYTTMRIGVDLTKLGLPPIPMDAAAGTIGNTDVPKPGLVVANARGPWEVDRTGTRIYFSEVDERYRSMVPGMSDVLGGPFPDPITISYKAADGQQKNVTAHDVTWLTELPEQSMAFAADTNVNEGSIYAFADPQPDESGTSVRVLASKIWVFWTSTRGGNSDLFWQTLSPNFWAR